MPILYLGVNTRDMKAKVSEAADGLNAVGKAADRAKASADDLGAAISGATKKVLALVGAYKALDGVKNFVRRGIEFNSTLESSQIGMASIITSMVQLEDAQGKTLQGAQTRTAEAQKRVNAINANTAAITRQANAAETRRLAALQALRTANDQLAASTTRLKTAQDTMNAALANTRNIDVFSAGIARAATGLKGLWTALGGGWGVAFAGLMAGLGYLSTRQNEAEKAAEMHSNAVSSLEKVFQGAAGASGELSRKLSELEVQQVKMAKTNAQEAYSRQLVAVKKQIGDVMGLFSQAATITQRGQTVHRKQQVMRMN